MKKFLGLKQFFYFFFFFFSLIFSNKLYAANVAADTTYSSSVSGTQYNVTADDVDIIVTNDSTLSRSQKLFNNTDAERTGATLTIHSGSTITTTNSNTVFTGGGEFTITNSGTVSSSNSKSINISNSDSVSITNNSGGVISSGGNTILGTAGSGADNTTIDNSGEIFSTKSTSGASAIVVADNDSGTTITNNAGGSIYSKGTSSTIILGVSSTLTNSGSIKNNKSVDNDAIQLKGNNNTITLKDGGVVVGKIKAASGTTGNTLKLNHGVGKSYYYNTSGTFTLEDLDGNNVVKGSAGSVGQGGSEFIDESLGYKSLNIRKSLTQFKNSDQFLDRDTAWVETFSSLLKRDGKSSSLKLESSLVNFGANIIKPLENSNFIISAETSLQNISKDHDVDRISILSGFYFNNHQNNTKLKGEYFLLGGIALNKSERIILTNTTTSGLLKTIDDYENFEILFGNKLNNSFLIPDIGYTLGYSYTPSHKESKYFDWNNRHVLNISAAISDEYTFFQSDKENFSLGWIVDYRTLANNDNQNYKINGTKASYDQDDELKKEASFSGNLNYKYKANENSIFSFNLDGFTSSQDVISVLANLVFKFKI